MRFSSVFVSVLAGLIVAGCASKPKPVTSLSADRPITAASYQADEPLIFRPKEPKAEYENNYSSNHGLAGRTIYASSIRDIKLRNKEVILTFDDGPAPGKTERVLNALDQHGIKATFLMVGQMAKANPALAKRVAQQGHAIGSHTYNHDNLAKQSFSSAIDNIRRGERAVRAATGSEVAFFRFPYLSHTSKLRDHLASRGTVVLDVDVDSKDYFKVSPAHVVEQTMKRLHTKGNGIILLHDLHNRTATMLPTLLRRLKADGYKVVNLQPSRGAGGAVALLDN
ncbi:polysaccharide deacetylase family protein [Ahrensia kielensis]|uniref:polysaccharide deacetylase family protein n=1 Tax=Ahrensia kielensis TaxID=76980 RepID=UPI000369ACDE|nr:polysaccharide deacetylase family protein [Ahrensia kielensis]